jgi:hypothetical protein
MVWYVDFEAYQIDGHYYVKEIAIIDRHCYNYFIKNPRHLPYLPNNSTTYFQFTRHELPWNFGNVTFVEAIHDIRQKVKFDTIYCKGTEKTKFLKAWLPQTIEIDWIPAFNELNNCIHETCDYEHGNNCARRKVHEMQYADKQYHDSINKLMSLHI